MQAITIAVLSLELPHEKLGIAHKDGSRTGYSMKQLPFVHQSDYVVLFTVEGVCVFAGPEEDHANVQRQCQMSLDLPH